MRLSPFGKSAHSPQQQRQNEAVTLWEESVHSPQQQHQNEAVTLGEESVHSPQQQRQNEAVTLWEEAAHSPRQQRQNEATLWEDNTATAPQPLPTFQLLHGLEAAGLQVSLGDCHHIPDTEVVLHHPAAWGNWA